MANHGTSITLCAMLFDPPISDQANWPKRSLREQPTRLAVWVTSYQVK
jgi:hypothetical protein